MSQNVITSAGFSPVAAFVVAAREGVVQFKRLWQALENRKAVNALAECDPRMLKDIGLLQSDVAAALDQPIGRDPSEHLARLAAGRRYVRVA